MARLGDVGLIITGNTPKTSELLNYASDDICFVKPSDIADGMVTHLEDSEFYISEFARAKARILPPKSVLVTCIGIIGKVAINNKECAFNQQINAIIPDESKCLTEYLAYAIQNKQAEMQDIANAPVVPILNKTRFSDIEINLPSLYEQEDIVERLNVVSKLITLRKEQIAKLDQLVKSRFIELFGDPIRNTQSRPTTEFINVVKMQRGFDLPVQDRQQDGKIPVFGSNGALDRHNVAKVQGGGVITGRSGTIGKVYYTEGDYWPLNTSLFSVDTHGNNVVYLAHLLQMYDLSRFTEGTGVPTLNRNKFHNKPIIDVPLGEQEAFATLVKQTDKSKLAIQQSLDKLELLKKSLMQGYFGQVGK